MKLFLANITWTPYSEEKDQTDTCYVFADTPAEACEKLQQEFCDDLSLLTLKIINYDAAEHILFVPAGITEAINDANSY